jgi:large subunit ribosomal protein L18
MSKKLDGRARRRRRVRKKVFGSPQRGRLSVFRSHSHIYAQIVDDVQGQTLASASSLKLADLSAKEGESQHIAQARAVGQRLAERAKEKGIESVVFDRGGYRYHGRVAALATGARDAGLKF